MLALLIPSACGPGGLNGCPIVPPTALPSGRPPGTPIEGVAGGAKQVVWGDGADSVDLRIGLSYMAAQDMVLHEVEVRGQPGFVFQIVPETQVGLGLTWSQGGCDYTVFLDSSVSASELADFASRY